MSVIHTRRLTTGDRYEVIPHSVLRDSRLSYRARGLLGYLLSLPPVWKVAIERLADESPREAREAVQTAVAELETVGYLWRWRDQDERGYWRVHWEYATDPAVVQAARAEHEEMSAAADIVAGQTGDGLSVSGLTCDDAPTDQSPQSGHKPQVRTRVIRSRTIRDRITRQQKRSTDGRSTEKVKTPPSPTPQPSPAEAPATAQEEGGVIDLRTPTPTDRDDAMGTQAPAVDMRDQAVALVEALPDPWRPSQRHKQRPEILRLVADALAEGWAPAALTHHLLSDPPRELHAPGRLLVSRLQELPAPRRGRPRQRVAVSDPHASDLAQSHAAGALQDAAKISAHAAATRAAVRQTKTGSRR